jgi:hypothetical protein
MTDRTDGHAALERFLRTDPQDPGCEQVMEHLDAYVELVLAGADPEETYPGLTAHLRSCSPCAEDFDGLLALLRDAPAD